MSGRTSFDTLSADIKTLIVGRLSRPTDLKNVCLTSHQLHAIAVRELYHSVTLDVGGPKDIRLTALMNPRNIGLPFMRKLDLYLADVSDKCNQIQQAHFAVRMILEFLPENVLEKFSWHPWSAFSADNMLMLYQKQRRLKWLEGIAISRDIYKEIEKLPYFDPSHPHSLFSNTRKLGLYPDCRQVLSYCQSLIERTRRLDKLTLHASFDDMDPPIPNRELNDSSTGPGLITSTLFSHMMPFGKCTPLTLQDLTLQKVSLRYCSETFCRVIDFSGIKCIRIFNCSGADALFAELSKSSQLPDRLEVLEIKHDDNVENDCMNALDGFLLMVSGIKELAIDMCMAKSLPSADAIKRHRATLKSLIVHANSGDGDVGDEEHVYSLSEFEGICKDCSLLEQLSVAFPATGIARGRSEEFKTFQDAVLTLPSLRTLNITTWPTSPPTRLPRDIYDHLLRDLAESMFNISAANANPLTPCPASTRLNVVAFGTSDRVYDRDDSKNQSIFVKGRQIDPFGHESLVAVQTGWCLRKYVEPSSDVLDFSLARSTRPPTKESSFADED